MLPVVISNRSQRLRLAWQQRFVKAKGEQPTVFAAAAQANNERRNGIMNMCRRRRKVQQTLVEIK